MARISVLSADLVQLIRGLSRLTVMIYRRLVVGLVVVVVAVVVMESGT